jgi:hypothetical protein
VELRLRRLPMRRMRLARVRRLCRLRRLLLVLGTLPPLLNRRCAPIILKDANCCGRVLLDPAGISLFMTEFTTKTARQRGV